MLAPLPHPVGAPVPRLCMFPALFPWVFTCCLCVPTTPAPTHHYTCPHAPQEWKCDIGYEQFLAPEMFFNPEIYSEQFATPLPQVVDDVILATPIDCRRGLYNVRRCGLSFPSTCP